MASYVSVGALPTQCASLCEPPAETLRERFHGALLGLWVAPIAMSLVANRGANAAAGMDALEPNADPHEMAATLANGFALMHSFASAADAFRQPLSVLLESALVDPAFEGASPRPLPVWLVSVPMLLRYHDSRSLRLQWLDSQQSSLRELAHANQLPWAVAAEQIMQLGDFLEMALSGWTPPLLDYVTELRGELPSPATAQAATAQAAAAQAIGCDDCAKVLISALGGLPADFFTLGSVFPLALWQPRPCKGEQMLLIGLLAGLLNGSSQVPVLWQLTGPARSVYGCDLGGNIVSRGAIVGMANQLFDQWAGIQPI